MLSAFSELGVSKVDRIFVTHHHGDHTNGNALCAPVSIVAQRNVSEELREGLMRPPGGLFDPVEWGDIEVRYPDVTFESEIHFDLGATKVHMIHLGFPAHTRGDSVVYLPEHKVLFSGDLAFNGVTPFALMGSVPGWIASLDILRSFDVETVVPGHGDICGKDVFDEVERYLCFVQEVAKEAVVSGLGPLEAARELDLGGYSELADPERIVGNLHVAMAELTGSQVDLFRAFEDMVAYNGGRPLRCLA
jgi:cyclase